MKKKLSGLTRILLLVAAAGLVFVLFTPMWRIELSAPQYPEGLNLQINANGLSGNVDIINGLNHYIGMKTLHNEDFMEFTILPYLIIFFALLFVLAAVINKRKFLNLSFILFVAFGILAMYDFWRWEYNYGHNLNPNAAIIVPGMAYQPPLIGFKQLLNFGAYSVPDTGGWLFVGAGVLLMFCVLFEWRRHKKLKINFPTAILLLPVLLSSCTAGPQPIVTGKDNCYFCKMTIADARYGAELVTKKGKLYKFDDLHCLLSFTKTKAVDDEQVKDIYVVDYAGSHALVKAAESFFIRGDAIHGPMNGNTIAFSNKDSMQQAAAQLKAAPIKWEQLYQ